jgi:murein DD-endopeptidase MepM/ murein hydrolase activator NlpD
LDRNRPYRGRTGTTRRRRSSAAVYSGNKSSKRAVKLLVCVALFVIAAFMKLVFPSALQAVGDKLNTVVNYRAALAALGEGISGEKKFTAALGEAFTYAFTGTPADISAAPSQTPAASGNPSASPGAAGDGKSNTALTDDDAVQTFSESSAAPTSETGAASSASPGSDAAGVADSDKSFSDAVIAAFMENQEQYSDYAVPAGVSYAIPKLGISYVKPVDGVVSSSFGYRLQPADNEVEFHFGTDIVAKTGTTIVAFSDGKVIAAGVSKTRGNYVLLSQGGVETEYAHCDELLVEAGQAVKKGDRIATVGNTGNATETSLHFELRVNGIYVNPEFYIQWT